MFSTKYFKFQTPSRRAHQLNKDLSPTLIQNKELNLAFRYTLAIQQRQKGKRNVHLKGAFGTKGLRYEFKQESRLS